MASATVVTTDESWEEPEKTRESGTPPPPGVTISHTGHGETRVQNFTGVTPLYKSGPVTNVPHAMGVGIHINRESHIEPEYRDVPDYRLEREKQSFNLHIIDPKVEITHSAPLPHRVYHSSYKTPDFPSIHSKRSFLKLDALEPRRTKSARCITPTDYLTLSLERHRKAYASPQLRQNLRVSEKSVSEKWCAPSRPGPQKRPPLEDISATKLNRSASWEYSPRTIVKVEPPHIRSPAPQIARRPPPPQPCYVPVPVYIPVNYEKREERKSNVKINTSRRMPPVDPNYDRGNYGTTIIKVKDETVRRPKQKKMKQRVLREFEEEKYTENERKVQSAPIKNVIETTESIEECKKTEQVERRVRSSKNDAAKDQRSRSSHGGRFIDDGFSSGGRRIVDHNGSRQQTITREYHGEKGDDFYDRGKCCDDHRQPVVEFPPSLPRSEQNNFYGSMTKRHHCRDYDDELRRHNRDDRLARQWQLEPLEFDRSWHFGSNHDAVTDLEREFRDAALVPFRFGGGQNVEEREYRENKIPYGQESFKREMKAESGSSGPNRIYNTAKQEIHFNREQEFDDRGR